MGLRVIRKCGEFRRDFARRRDDATSHGFEEAASYRAAVLIRCVKRDAAARRFDRVASSRRRANIHFF